MTDNQNSRINLDTIIKELMVDWDYVLSDSFNPLHYALKVKKNSIIQSDFRDMFHKLELTMDNIIEKNYKGFSDSILNYNEFNKMNLNCFVLLKEILTVSHKFKNTSFDIKNISNEKSKADYCNIKLNICNDLYQANELLKEYGNTGDILKKAHMLIECQNLIDNSNYIKIKSLIEYRKMIHLKYVELADEANKKIANFVFKNKLDLLHYLKVVKTLGSLDKLDSFFEDNFQSYVFIEIESVIVSKHNTNTVKVENICKSVIKKVESIIFNMETLLSKLNNTLGFDKLSELTNIHKNVFSDRIKKKHSFITDITTSMDIIKDELSSFISRYSKHISISKMNFKLDNVIDNIDYSTIYRSSHSMTKKLLEKNKEIGKIDNEYSIMVVPNNNIPLYMLKYTKKKYLKTFLNEKIKNYCDKYNLKFIVERFDNAFKKYNFKLNYKTKTLKIYDYVFSLIGEKTNEHNQCLKDTIIDKICMLLLEEYYNVFPSKTVKFSIDDTSIEKHAEDFRGSLIQKHITKKELFLKQENYQKAIFIIKTIRNLSFLHRNSKLVKLYEMYFESFKSQFYLDIFYFYGLMIRQGNCKYYIKNIVRIIDIVYNESENDLFFKGIYKTIELFTIRNSDFLHVRNKDELLKFINYLKILDEIMAEIKFGNDLKVLYKFYDEVIDGTSTNIYGKNLMKKINV